MPRENKHTSSLRWADGVPAIDDKIWPRDKHRLQVRFLDGSSGEKQLVESLVKEHYHAIPMHIRFKFLKSSDTGPSDIRIMFTYSGCSSSCVGRDNANVASNDHTMKLNMNRSSIKVQADVLHEFGHALGLEHEQKHPACDLRFSRTELKRRYGYDDDFINRNYGRGNVIGARTTPYNIESIMHYPVERGDTESLKTYIPLNTVLSAGDKEVLMTLYPIAPERKHKSKSSERSKSKKSERSKSKTSERGLVPYKPTTTVDERSRHRTKQQPPAIYTSRNRNKIVQDGYVMTRDSGSAVFNDSNGVAMLWYDNMTLKGNGTDVKISGKSSVKLSGGVSIQNNIACIGNNVYIG